MAIIKCKMCGGDLNLMDGSSVAVCEYCGSQQTVPSADNEKKLTLFARANRLRAACEFDKAAGVYESIVADFPEEAEAYWGLVLCRYGIEYVDDPATGRKIPTCHRSSFDSVLEDSDFEQALENADAVARRVYRDEAKAIEGLRRGIVEVSGKEPPYDIFICYKETDENGERTVDSVIAQDVYDALTEKGYRVFFSRISLEDKLGTEYEPYIFAALHSAKIMLAFGTDYEYYNAVWVKNEWSRYLQLMTKDKSKHLIPCYKGIDAYDMPKEFAKLQAQDMGKVGAMQDLLRGVDKIMGGNSSAAAQPPQAAANATAGSLLKRAQMFLEDKNWDRATEYAEKVLDIDPECADAYMVLLLATWRIRTWAEVGADIIQLVRSREYKRARQFASGALADKLADAKRLANEYAERLEQEKKQRIEEAKRHKEEKTRLKEEAKRRQEEEARRQEEEARRQEAERLRREEEEARKLPEKLRTYYRCHAPSMVVCGGATVGLRENGTVLACGKHDDGQCDVSDWTDIVAAAAGSSHTVGLKSDGTVVACGWNAYGQCDVSGWTDIVAVAAGMFHAIGLKSDGTVVACGENNHGQCNVSNWTDIVAVAAGDWHTVGLKSDGTVVVCGNNGDGQCDVSNWTDIVTVAAYRDRTVGLKSDGTVVACGKNDDGQCDVSDWADIVAVAVGNRHTVGLNPNGTVVACGKNDDGQCDVSDWTDIVAVAAGYFHTVGLKSDGTVVAYGGNKYGQCDVSHWRGVVAVTAGDWHTVGVKSDGTVVACGLNAYGRCDVSDWKLFDSFDDVVNRAVAKEEQRKEEEERFRAKEEQRKAAVKKREAERKAEEEKRKAAAEKRRLDRIAALETEKRQIETELPHIKGLFSGGKRRDMENRLAAIEKELRELKN